MYLEYIIYTKWYGQQKSPALNEHLKKVFKDVTDGIWLLAYVYLTHASPGVADAVAMRERRKKGPPQSADD